jgi:hypothetical protein
MGHKVVVELPSTAMIAVEICLSFQWLPLSNESRDELCRTLGL